MPIYDYVCTNCGYEVEVTHSVHGHGPSGCPKCGGRMRKAIGAAAVHFKGSGWARQDRATGRPSKSASVEASSAQGEAPALSTESGGTSNGASPKDSD